MICPECETEYREGFTTCSDCDVALVAELGTASLVPLTMERSPDLVAAVVEALETAEIPYVIEARNGVARARRRRGVDRRARSLAGADLGRGVEVGPGRGHPRGNPRGDEAGA